MEELITLVKDLSEDIKELSEEIKEIRKDQKGYLEEIINLRKENNELKEKLEKLEKKVENMERRNKQNNIVLTGVEIKSNNPKEIKEQVENSIHKYLGIRPEIVEAKKINERICVVEMKNLQGKNEIMENKNKLRKLKDVKMFINNDLTDEERRIQKHIRDEARKQKEMGKKVIVGYKKLTVNNITWTWNNKTEQLDTGREERRNNYPKN